MLKFFAGIFAVAGLAAATGPIIIHLLNRRRFRTIEWGAMDFLRQAMQRNRRAVQLRDLIVLVLRCLAVAAFGVALARPFLSGVSSTQLLGAIGTGLALIVGVGAAAWGILTSGSKRTVAFGISGLAVAGLLFGLASMLSEPTSASEAAVSSRHPLHAIVILDNSMSMAYESLEGALLDQAKTRAAEFVDALPGGSRVHVIPLCGGEAAGADSAYRNKADARAALDRIRAVDRIGRASHGFDLAIQASRQIPELETKRIVFISDQQASLWAGGVAKEQLKELGDVQILQVASETVENIWVSDFSLLDGIADTETPSVFIATIRHAGADPLADVQVTLKIDGLDVATQLTELEPGQAREVEFRHKLDGVTDTGDQTDSAGRSAFVKATVTVSAEGGVGDRLARDNSRHLVVPVVAGLPVVFIDQFGDTEDLDRNEIGETYRLRRLLAPQTANEDEVGRQLIRIRHLSMDRVDEAALSDARLVVVAGVESPGEAVPVLRQYVEQGGSLVIAAGADFDADRWQESGWQNGAGILPAPLDSEPIGQLPEVALAQIEPFFLDFRSLQHDYFLIEGESTEALEDLYRMPIFFKAIGVNAGTAMSHDLVEAEVKRIEESRQEFAEIAERRSKYEELERQGNVDDDSADQRAIDEERLRELSPEWLVWADTDRREHLKELSPQDLALASRPRVLARYSGNNNPFLVERQIGAGKVLFLSTGLYSSWNIELTSSNAILMFDRMLRQLLRESLPRRNFETGDDVTLPAQKADRLRWDLNLPDGTQQSLAVEALSSTRFGVIVRNANTQGHYEVRATDASDESANGASNAIAAEGESKAGKGVSAVPLAFNCPSEESEIDTFDSLAFQERMGNGTWRWLEAGESISMEGSQVRGRDFWKWLVVVVIVFLLTEMTILAWPNRGTASVEVVPVPDA
ncbi:MAG: BatA domain-containing protein [Planctomycetota bacterium]|nr:BatA domain-containing protein [Planctomycetota bacterium]MDA1249588.1 BatA domain-containing protein [Planctomycetota bacterium]